MYLWLKLVYVIAVVLHSAFNHFFFSPRLSTFGVALVVPALLFVVFERSEKAVGRWLGTGFGAGMPAGTYDVVICDLEGGKPLEAEPEDHAVTRREDRAAVVDAGRFRESPSRCGLNSNRRCVCGKSGRPDR